MEKGAIFPLFYLPTIEYFSKLVFHKPDIVIEKHEHFPKQTYRNRASIYSPNGKLDLIVPIVRGSKNHTAFKDVKICYEFNWQRIHWMSLETCYRSSAFFEYYEDDFAVFYNKRHDFLFDFNQEILNLLLRLIKLKIDYSFTSEYEKDISGLVDYRDSMKPKEAPSTQIKPYYQIFEDKHGFMPNLSVIDLLFNQGPQTLSYL
ncbi:MAG: hypothetical protein JWN56_2105 [Sphingobacteriales bacterium]|nr:hypothetical protein [Sphingobacteriales bacterium]